MRQQKTMERKEGVGVEKRENRRRIRKKRISDKKREKERKREEKRKILRCKNKHICYE